MAKYNEVITTETTKTISTGEYRTVNGSSIYINVVDKDTVKFSTNENDPGWWINYKDAFELSKFFKEIGVFLKEIVNDSRKG